MKYSIRKIKPEDTMYAERMVMKTTNILRKLHNLPPQPYKPTRKQNAMFCHLLKTDPGAAYGAFIGGKIIGYASAMIRDGHWYLAHLFTDPKYQGKGIGRKLLKKVMDFAKGKDVHTYSLATFAFNPHAVQLYSQFGMNPLTLLPMMVWKNNPEKRVRKISHEYDIKMVPLDNYKQIEILNRFDKRNRGIYRPEDHKFWMDSERVHGFIFRTGRKTIGYTWILGNAVIAPLTTSKPEYLIPCLADTINYMRSRKFEKIIVWVPGNNGSVIEFLYKAGFKLEENELLMSDKLFARDDCYIPASLAFY